MTIETFKMQQQMLQDMLNSGPQMWALYLNNMTMSQIQQSALVAIFDSAELAQAFLDEQRLPDDKYITVREGDRDWSHAYRPGPLWWYNPSFSFPDQGIISCKPWVDYFTKAWPDDSLVPENPSGRAPFDILHGDINEESKKLLAEWQEAGKI